ncbi:MAG TPA: hydantoinase/carbamoylase family amidase [Solirubrobacteraceae bacterium]
MSDSGRIDERLEALWQIARGPGGGADRPAFSSAEAVAMTLVAGWARSAGLEPGIDRHGNLWALPSGWDGPLVTSGSHVDTVPDGGRYDGALGTVLALELAEELGDGTDGGARPAVLVCAAEEAPRFGAGTIGSRLLVGALASSELEGLKDAAGVSAAEARGGYARRLLPELPAIEPPPFARIRAHVEIHVALRRALREIGVVRRVASPRRLEIELTGAAGHAGEISMEDRRDALAAAAEVVLGIEEAARAEPAETVATVGTVAIDPGAMTVIPGRVRLGVDLRAIDRDSLERLEQRVRGATEAVAQARGIAATLRLLRGGDPVELDPRLADQAMAAAGRLGVAAVDTWSGAGHDAQHLAAVIPALLLFVPLHGGESHTPLEGADPAEIAASALLAFDVLRQL